MAYLESPDQQGRAVTEWETYVQAIIDEINGLDANTFVRATDAIPEHGLTALFATAAGRTITTDATLIANALSAYNTYMTLLGNDTVTVPTTWEGTGQK